MHSTNQHSRRDFLIKTAIAATAFTITPRFVLGDGDIPAGPLLDWSLWKKFRGEVTHPALTIKKADITRARLNIQKYTWAKNYAENIDRNARLYLHLINPESLNNLIEETTPGDPLWTPCPACRKKGKPVHPHGLWRWEIDRPNELECTICETVFPNAEHPEDIVLETTWKKPQKITFYGGDTFEIFGFKKGRPSFTANIRSRKVQWCANYSRMLAEAYCITGNSEYASAAQKILLRFADCYPNWLVHVGYGEYADMDPRIAAQNIKKLPQPELTPPPNIPDKMLWTGFWTAGRATGVGLEADFIRKVVEAYDLTCDARDKKGVPVYSEADRVKIEHDLLLESTILLVNDKQINNKAVSNRTAVALVGMCVGHPEMVRFGLEGFNLTVNNWFLNDGTTSESAFYGLMTLGGIWDLGQACRNYSDPSGYLDKDGKRIDGLDLYKDKAYDQIWQAFFNGLQGDLNYPPYADSFLNVTLDDSYVELMVANYPERKEYLALLKILCGSNLSKPAGPVPPTYYIKNQEKLEFTSLVLPYDLAKPNSSSSFSLYYRSPGLELAQSPAFRLPDWCPAELRIGHMRTGADGRESLLTQSASHWGVHHEWDSLNLYYWKNGSEILSDLGYLWDHPLKYQTTMRTLAHNTVIINEKNQRSTERGGTVHLFKTSKHVKVMEASSDAYAETSLYKRTSAIIDHGNGKNYVVDFFRVSGGEIQDFVFHTDDTEHYFANNQFQPDADARLYDLKQIKTHKSSNVWTVTWTTGKDMRCKAWSVPQEGEAAFIGDGWGQRDWKNSDIGRTIPYIVRRCKGNGVKTFISVFEGYQSPDSFVKNVAVNNGILIIDTAAGRDYIMSNPDRGILRVPIGSNIHQVSGQFVCVSVLKEEIAWEESFV
ncbi:MAG TPA: heparinase II/III family protein [Sphingobacteriaceae bacterium]